MDAETNCLLCSHGWHGDWCSVSYGGGLSCACRKSPAPQQPPAQGIDCPRCEATGTEPDPDPHDERSYPCALCSGSGEITRAVRDAIRDAVPPSAADSAGEAQRTAEERLAAVLALHVARYPGEVWAACDACNVTWPCATARAAGAS